MYIYICIVLHQNRQLPPPAGPGGDQIDSMLSELAHRFRFLTTQYPALRESSAQLDRAVTKSVERIAELEARVDALEQGKEEMNRMVGVLKSSCDGVLDLLGQLHNGSVANMSTSPITSITTSDGAYSDNEVDSKRIRRESSSIKMQNWERSKQEVDNEIDEDPESVLQDGDPGSAGMDSEYYTVAEEERERVGWTSLARGASSSRHDSSRDNASVGAATIHHVPTQQQQRYNIMDESCCNSFSQVSLHIPTDSEGTEIGDDTKVETAESIVTYKQKSWSPRRLFGRSPKHVVAPPTGTISSGGVTGIPGGFIEERRGYVSVKAGVRKR